MSANTYGRQVILPLTNKSGGGVIAGDVVVIDTTNNDAFTTSTAGAFTGLVGIAQETIANNAVGRVLTSGYAALVNTNASVTRGNFGKTYTVAKQATDAGASRVTGTFCQFLTGGTTPDASLFGLVDAATGGALTDHTHAATGTGANGGGATLSPVTLNIASGTPATTEGQTMWDGTSRGLLGYDSVQAKGLSAIGWQPYATPNGINNESTLSGTRTLAAVSGGNGGAFAIPIWLVSPMKLDSYTVWCTDTANARAAEARLYVDRLNNSATANFLTGTDAAWSFTPGAASSRLATVSGTPVIIPPGVYWFVIRNTSATQTFDLASTGSSTAGAIYTAAAAQAIAALGSTLDLVTSWSSTAGAIAVRLNGRVLGQTSPY